ncbi:hypothetical protein BB560_004037 [Smittium megazygosporum]|uniref:Needs CLA4 to survive protein 3 n=1 Tax=Smittium megazygosporum TaxID=133381 RepID=A0A2T9ZAB4_9FUNG|nr:hypothetical protein BB560_004037 [Smittium megazygosporum]
MDFNKDSSIQTKAELEQIQASIAELKQKESILKARLASANSLIENQFDLSETLLQPTLPPGLTSNDISRYSRHLLLPAVGIEGQTKLKKAKVLVIGVGGLGSSALLYLSSMGIGEIGIVDFDSVDKSNLHRQIIHNEARQNMSKAKSAMLSINLLNSSTKVSPILEHLNSSNALQIFKNYDIILDATDNLPTRYLINDACVLLGKPLVYGSALRLDGQLVVYNYNGGPCYRCLFPKPPKFDPKQNCSEAGVLGVVPGIIGCLQALQAVKIILSSHPSTLNSNNTVSSSSSNTSPNTNKYYMTTFSAFAVPQFKSIQIRGRQPSCEVCGDNPNIKHLIDYPAFCGASQSDDPVMLKVLDEKDPFRISCTNFAKLRVSNPNHILLDVREKSQYDICSLRESIHIPFSDLQALVQADSSQDSIPTFSNFTQILEKSKTYNTPIYCICRRGNLSQLAVVTLRNYGLENCYQIDGGLTEWQKSIDPLFPSY